MFSLSRNTHVVSEVDWRRINPKLEPSKNEQVQLDSNDAMQVDATRDFVRKPIGSESS